MSQEIGKIANYYGGLNVKEEGGAYYWSIENYDGFMWEEIPKYLYDALTRFAKDDDFEAKIAGLKARVARLLEFTKEQEWSSHGGSRCPVCGAWDSDGHTERCKLASLIRECEGGE